MSHPQGMRVVCNNTVIVFESKVWAGEVDRSLLPHDECYGLRNPATELLGYSVDEDPQKGHSKNNLDFAIHLQLCSAVCQLYLKTEKKKKLKNNLTLIFSEMLYTKLKHLLTYYMEVNIANTAKTYLVQWSS